MPAPLISVIIVCRNPGPRLHAALASVWEQRDGDGECVVIDGASTDGTPEWLETQRTILGSLVSEPDRGIYDAMNKGVARATGEWVIFLGADDRLAAKDILQSAAKTLRGTTASICVGEARFDDGRRYAFLPDPAPLRRNFVHHQATFYRRRLFAKHGGFDERLRLQADYDFNLRLLLTGVQFTALPLRIADCGSGGLSDAGRWANYREEIAVRHRHFPSWRCWLWDVGSILRWLRKKLVRLSQ